jgi:CRP-like cAMP-binding protein
VRLRDLPLFAELPSERIREVAKQVQLARYRSREPLCEAGAAEGPMFVLLDGDARVELPGDDAHGSLDVVAGEFIGARTAMYGGLRDVTVRAKDALDAAVFAPSLVRALAREFPALRASIEAAARDRASDLLPRIAPSLKRLDVEAREKLLSQFETVALPEGALLFIEGEPVRWLHLVAAGEAEVYGPAFGVKRTRHARAGEIVGAVPLMAGEPSGVTARAAGPMLVSRLAASRFKNLIEKHREFADALGTATNLGAGVVC